MSRRRFLKTAGMFITLYLLPLNACRRLIHSDENAPGSYALSKKERQIMDGVMLHLFPAEGEGPGASGINAPKHFEYILRDKHLSQSIRKLLISGIKWTEETANELFDTTFTGLDAKQREEVLRDLETYNNGEKWLSKVLNYIFEALLGAPAYNINTDQSGWNWLDHTPGFPQPTPENIYGTYGYGL